MKYILLAALSVVGIIVSLPFLLIQSGSIAANSRYLPAFCRLDQRTCVRVLSHPDARLLGVPNAIPGVVYYILVLIVALGAGHPLFETLVLILSWVTVAVAGYLVYSLFFRVKAPCPLCLVSHGINLLLFVMLTFW